MTVDAPQNCPAASASADTGATVESVDWSATATDGTVTEEFTLDAPMDDPSFTAVFETEGHTRYRFERDADQPCVCEVVELNDCPLSEVRAEDGQLHMTFYAPDVESVRSIVADLRAQYDDVHLRHLCRSGDLDSENLVLVDRNRLTDRQREVLETAYEAGYFEHPKAANASEIAEELGISLSTFTEHLSLAQSKILDSLVEG